MSTSSSECRVLVLGAGPTGLVLVAQPLARGIRTRIAGKIDGPARESYRRPLRTLARARTRRYAGVSDLQGE